MNDDTAKTLLAAGGALSEFKVIPGPEPALTIVPEGYVIQGLEKHLDQPRRIRAHVETITAESFCDYYEAMVDNAGRLFVDDARARVVAVIDYDTRDRPSWREHTVTYAPPRELAWQRWCHRDGKPMTQVGFAEFIEENAVDVVEPPGAELLEMALTLHATKKAEFVSEHRLADGSRQFTFAEEVQGKGKRTAVFPEKMKLRVPVFFGEPPEDVTCLLRFRVGEEGLRVLYVIHRREFVEREAFEALCQRIEDRLEVKLLRGTLMR